MTPEARLQAARARARLRAPRVILPSDNQEEELEEAYRPVYGPALVLDPNPPKRRLKVVQERPPEKLEAELPPDLPPEYVAPAHLARFRGKRVALLPVQLELHPKVAAVLPFIEDGDKRTPYYLQEGRRWFTITWRELQWALQLALRKRLRLGRGPDDVFRLLAAGWSPEELTEAGVRLTFWRRSG